MPRNNSTARKASQFISWDDLPPGSRVVLCARVSTETQRDRDSLAQYASARAAAKARHANHAFDEMTFQEKRELCKAVFSGLTAEGKKMGIWITWSDDGKKWSYQIQGHLIDASGPVNKNLFESADAPTQKGTVIRRAKR